MTPNSELTGASAEVADTVHSIVTSYATLIHKGIERLAGLQKATLDVVAQQTVDLNAMLRKNIQPGPEIPGAALLDFTGQAVEGWVGAQKNVVDLMVEQSAQALEAAKESGKNSWQSVAILTELARRSAEGTVEAQKAVLDFAAKQNKAASELIQKQAAVLGSPIAKVAESVEQGVATVIDTHKEVLDAAAEFATAGGRA